MSSNSHFSPILNDPLANRPKEGNTFLQPTEEELHRTQDQENLVSEQKKHLEEGDAPYEFTLKEGQHDVGWLESQIKEHCQQVAKLKKELEIVQKKLASEESNRQRDTAQYEKKISDLEGKNSRLQKLDDENKVQREKQQEEIKSEKQKYSDLNEQMMKLTFDQKVLEEKVKTLNSQKSADVQTINDQKEKLRQNDKEFAKLKTTISDKEQQIQQYMSQVDELQPYKTKDMKVPKEVMKLQQEVMEQEKTAAAQRAIHEQLKIKEADVTQKMKKSSELNVELEKQVSSVQGENDSLKKVIQNLKKEAGERFDATQTLEVKVTKLIAQQETKDNDEQKAAQVTENKIMNLQTLVMTLKEKITQQNSLYKKVIAEKDDVSRQLTKAQESIKINNKMINEQKENESKQAKKILTLIRTLAKLKFQNSSMVKKMERAQKEVETSKNALLVTELSAEKKQLQNDKQFAALKDEKDKLVKELEHYKRMTKQQMLKITMLQEAHVAKQLKLTDCAKALSDIKLELKKSDMTNYNVMFPMNQLRGSGVKGKMDEQHAFPYFPTMEEECGDMSGRTCTDSMPLSSEVE